ncbi:MAG: RDD family protein, partial [Actinobacteria bacterium]|nr:RDD family protein [Actinomycetota bacterium]
MIERPTRVVGRRVIAYIIDLVILGAIDAALWLALTSSKPKATSTGGLVIGNTRHGFTSSGNRTLWFVLIAVTALLLFVVLPGLRGWSPGKLLVGIRLVNAEGVPPGILRSLLREVLWIVDGFPGYGLPLVGFITALATKANQRVGDLVARTYVVRAGAAGRPIGQLVPEIAGFPPGTRPTAAAPSPPAATT